VKQQQLLLLLLLAGCTSRVSRFAVSGATGAPCGWLRGQQRQRWCTCQAMHGVAVARCQVPHAAVGAGCVFVVVVVLWLGLNHSGIMLECRRRWLDGMSA
jgi:hypothetical protein